MCRNCDKGHSRLPWRKHHSWSYWTEMNSSFKQSNAFPLVFFTFILLVLENVIHGVFNKISSLYSLPWIPLLSPPLPFSFMTSSLIIFCFFLLTYCPIFKFVPLYNPTAISQYWICNLNDHLRTHPVTHHEN